MLAITELNDLTALDALLASQTCKEKIDDQNVNGDTAISVALQRGNTVVANRLLMAGASLMCKNNSGKTPLMIASQRGDLDFIDTFIQCGTQGLLDIDENGDTPLINVVKNILPAKPNLDSNQISRLLSPFMNPSHISHTNRVGLSALFYALNNSHAANILLSRGADPLSVKKALESRLTSATSEEIKRMQANYENIQKIIRTMRSAKQFHDILVRSGKATGNALADVNKVFKEIATQEMWDRAIEVDQTLSQEEDEIQKRKIRAEIIKSTAGKTQKKEASSCNLQ